MSEQNDEKPPGLFNIIKSVLCAMIGIQTEENRKKDFESGNVGSYIAVGVVVVIIFIFTLILL